MMDEDTFNVTSRALTVITSLNGLSISDARQVLRIAETLLLQTHTVDVNHPELQKLRREELDKFIEISRGNA